MATNKSHKQGSPPPQETMNAQQKTFEVVIKKDKCKGCGLCIVHCPTQHLVFSAHLNKRGVPFVQIKKGTFCRGCGFCYQVCPESCIEVYEIK